MTILSFFGAVSILGGMVFFVGGTVGLLRFPDVYTRLHAVTKADNLGVGLIALGLALHEPDWAKAAKLALVWLLTLAALAVSSNVLAATCQQEGIEPWKVPGE